MRSAGGTDKLQPKAWSRLKAVRPDPLEAIGLPSKGDNRLLDLNAQRRYYDDIVSRCLDLPNQNIANQDLDEQLRALNLVDHHRAQESPLPSSGLTERELLALQNILSLDSARTRNVSVIAQAMRKLREAIVATGRCDGFAQNVYVFVIRATISLRHMESYHPALALLLKRMHHPKAPLSTHLLREMQGYHVLDLACRQKDLGEAYCTRLAYGLQDRNIDGILKAVAHGNWMDFWKFKSRMNHYQQRLVEYASDSMRRHAIGCLGKAFLSVEKDYVEKAVQRPWQLLVNEYAVQWQAEKDMIVIRQMKRK